MTRGGHDLCLRIYWREKKSQVYISESSKILFTDLGVHLKYIFTASFILYSCLDHLSKYLTKIFIIEYNLTRKTEGHLHTHIYALTAEMLFI